VGDVSVGEEEEMVVFGESVVILCNVEVVAVDSLRPEDREEVSALCLC
jgi:hypothetical protein